MNIYSERAPMSLVIRAFTASVVVVLLILLGWIIFVGGPWQVIAIITAVTLLLGWAMYGYWTMRFAVERNQLAVVYWPFKYRIKLKDITSIRKVDRKFLHMWWGWGIRFGFRRVNGKWIKLLAFMSQYRKDAVLIEKKSGIFKKVIFSTRNTDRFIKEAKKRLG